MSYSIDFVLTVIDKASAATAEVANKIEGGMQKVENATKKVDEANKKVDSSAKDLVTGFSGVATGAFALYMTIDRVEKSQYALEKANLAVKRANESVEAAQNKYNEAVSKFGVGSKEAKDASDKLAIAQDAFALANDRASLAQGNVNQAMLQGALTIVPTLITIVSSAKNALGGMEGAQKLLNQAMDANPIFLVIGAIAALVAILVTAYYTIEPFRNAVDGLGRFLGLLPPALDDSIAATKEYQKATESANSSVLEAQKRVEATSFAQANFTNTLLDASRQVSSYDELLTRNCSTLEDYQDLSSDASEAVEILQGRMKDLQAECEAANRVLESQIDNLGAGSAAVSLMGRDTDRLTVQEKNSGSAIDELNRQIAENTDLTEAQIESIKKQIDELLRLAQRAEDTADLMKDLSDSYGVLRAAADASLPSVARQFDEAFKSGRIEDATSIIIDFADKLGISFGDAQKIFDEFISDLDKVQKRVTGFRDSLVNDYEAMKAKADSNLGAIHDRFMSAFDAGAFAKAEMIVSKFADKYGISLEAARTIIESWTASVEASTDTVVTETETVISEFDKFQTKITEQFEVAQAAADENLAAIASAFDAAFNAGRFSDAAGVVQAFANQYGISFDQAERIINNFTDEQEKALKRIPLTIEQELIGKAQADFQAFTDCVTGKARTLNTDVTAQIDNLASNITALINKGLVGEAQAEMQAYVSCSTNKTATMVTDINGLMEKLTKDYNAQLALMTAEADRLTGEQRLAVLRNISALTADYEAKMANLRGWQQQLLNSMVTDADAAAAKILARMKAAIERASAAAEAAGGVIKGLGAPIFPVMLQEGGVVMSPTLAVIGERGREAVVPLEAYGLGGGGGRSVSITITGPLVNIEGSADRATAELAASMVEERLRNVIVEATSSGAPLTNKMIRYGNRVGI